MVSSSIEKQQIRNKILLARKNIPDDLKLSYSEQIVANVIKQEFYQQAQNIAVYYSLPNEVNTKILINNIIADNKNCFLPKVSNNNLLSFIKYNINDKLIIINNIYEPESNNNIDINKLDIIFLPLVAVDKFGDRLGFGKGYYDKTLAQVSQAKRPLLIGLAFKEQVVGQKLPRDHWDQKLDLLITPDIIYQF